MTTQQTDIWKRIGVALAIIAAVTGWGRDLVSDRFRMENRLTRIEGKVDTIAETVREVATQSRAIADLQARMTNVEREVERGRD